MKILEIRAEYLYMHTRLTIEIDNKDRMKLIKKLEALGTIEQGGEYDITIEKHRARRSKDANAYMWVLADKIADKTNTTKEDVYREAIRRVGVFKDTDVFKDVAVIDKAADWLVKSWEKNGIGWFAETFDSTLYGCKKVRLYAGSSTYNTKEMSRLIDELIEEARDLDIETATPDEIARMKSTWGER